MNDKQRQVRDALVGVLNEFDVVYEHTLRKRHPAIEFIVDGHRHVHTYTTGDPRSALNGKSQLRNRLKSLGAPLRVAPEPAEPIDDQPSISELPSEPYAQTAESEQPPPTVNAEMPTETETPKSAEQATADAAETETTTRTFTIDSQLNADGRHRVFRSARVIAIELQDDLILDKGNVLVIPLNRPGQFMDLRPDQFRALFEQLEVLNTAEVAPTAPPLRPTAERRPTPPQVAPAQPVIDPIEAVQPDPVRPEPPPRKPPPVAPSVKRPPGVEVRPSVPRMAIRTQTNEKSSSVTDKQQRTQRQRPEGFRPDRRSGIIQPQLGRMLAALLHASRTEQKDYVAPASVSSYLDTRDARQFTARLPGAVERNLAVRGHPLPNSRGWHYGITPEGVDVVRQAGDWPFACEGMMAPDWLDQLLEG